MGLHKINLKNGTATGMYLFAELNELKFDKFSNTQAPTGRAYKIQVEVEAIHNNKRCRGKKSYSIPSGTSMVSAVEVVEDKANIIKICSQMLEMMSLDILEANKIDSI